MEGDDFIYRLGLAMSRGVNAAIVRELSLRMVLPDQYFGLDTAELVRRTGASARRFDSERRRRELDAARMEAEFIRRNNIGVLFADDAAYPQRLLMCPDAPAVLFHIGPLPQYRHVLAVVGTRHCTVYGKSVAEHIIADLAAQLDDLLIVSGLAYGVDINAHCAAMTNGVPTGAVLAHGLNTIYPADHRDYARKIVESDGFLLTEYSSAAQIHRGNFLCRNRIVAGMADATLVVESDERGGAMVTARLASDYNREVFAVPGRTSDQYSRGCNKLIANDTAHICRNADDIIDILGWSRVPREGTQTKMVFEIPEKYRPVADAIRKTPDANINELAYALNMPVARLQALLFEMEMNDLGTTVPGGHFALNNNA